ncbi:energy transducer TonB [Thermosulfidibacter takaii]|nr:energy transducer TonB [Thermosulfidibacter takaii]
MARKLIFYMFSILLHVTVLVAVSSTGSKILKFHKSYVSCCIVRLVDNLSQDTKIIGAAPRSLIKVQVKPSFKQKRIQKREAKKVSRNFNKSEKKRSKTTSSKRELKKEEKTLDSRDASGENTVKSIAVASSSRASSTKNSLPAQETGIFSPPVPIKRVKPPYPYIARSRGYQGKVLLKALVDVQGDVKDVIVVKSSGYTILDKTAVEAIKQWKFEPAHLGAIRKEAWVEVPFVFKLDRGIN